MPERNLPNLKCSIPSLKESYTSPNSIRKSFKLRDDISRLGHGGHLRNQLVNVGTHWRHLNARRESLGLDVTAGLLLEFESFPEFDLVFESLDLTGSGIELMSVKKDVEGRIVATVYVPDGKLSIFLSKLERYLTSDAPGGKPRERNLVESIANIRTATLKGLWTDDERLFPGEGESIWWEVWLSTYSFPFEEVVSRFRAISQSQELMLQSEVLKLRDRAVLLAYGTRERLSESAELLGIVAEVRKAKATVSDLTELSPFEQMEWVDALVERVQPSAEDAPAVCVLDTGIRSGHPLLASHIAEDGLHSYDPSWGVDDHNNGPFAGHGTEMSGLCLYGDLFPLMLAADTVQLEHKLESVKILPENGVNDPRLYGEITRESIARVEASWPGRNRVFSMAVTADGRDNGYPSSWSTAVDRIAFGEDEGSSRLILISGGNVPPDGWRHYVNCNTLNSVKDPAQAWNAVSVGAYTDKVSMPAAYPEYTPLADSGGLSPTSCTSVIWNWSDTPVKPDIVMEGGNIGYDGNVLASKFDSLSLLTTGHDIINAPLVPTGETSAAVSQVARMAAIICARYPSYKPETVRALLVHSAQWTQKMREQFPGNSKDQKEVLLRHCGYGVPDLEKALYSANNSINMVIEDSIQPYEHGNRFHELKLHPLPWPRESLYELGNTPITMKVTLSYFVDSLAGRRGFQGKFTYPSHRLGFKLKRVNETVEEFRARINRVVRDNGVEYSSVADHGWFLGPHLQTRGSIASDEWSGSATDLADSEVIAVFPKVGWWRNLTRQRAWNNTADYSLVVSISTPKEDVDLYSLVAQQLDIMTPVPITIGG